MGFRTIVILNNDQCSSWGEDPALGKKIQAAAHGGPYVGDLTRIGGRVASCEHTSTRYLALVDYLTISPRLTPERLPPKDQQFVLDELTRLAEAYGYRLVKARAKRQAP